MYWLIVFFFKQKTAYEMRISDWSSDVCSSDLSRVRTMISHLSTGLAEVEAQVAALGDAGVVQTEQLGVSVSQLKEALNSISQPLSDSDTGTSRLIERIGQMRTMLGEVNEIANGSLRSEEHTSELQSLMRNSYAVFCL